MAKARRPLPRGRGRVREVRFWGCLVPRASRKVGQCDPEGEEGVKKDKAREGERDTKGKKKKGRKVGELLVPR